MPKIVGAIGTGMTAQAVVAFDTQDPADIDPLIAAAKASLDRSSFAQHARGIADHARKMLVAKGLPSDPAAAYSLSADGSWLATKAPRSEAGQEQLLSLHQVVISKGCEIDSPEGFAAYLLNLIHEARQHLAAGSTDEAMATAFAMGQVFLQAQMKEEWEPEAVRGLKVLEGARRGHEQVHGTAEVKARRRKDYRQAFDKLRKAGTPAMLAYEQVAQQFGTSPRTIQRAVAKAPKS